MLSLSLLASALAAVALASPHPEPQLGGRAVTTCNRDNLYRCFTASPAVVGPYCTSVIGTTTVTASTTITPSTSVTATATVFITATASATATTTSTSTITQTDSITSVITEVSTTLTTTTATISTGVPAFKMARRAVAGPPCLTIDGNKATSYPASRITSACSCLYTQATATVTPTAPVTTITQTVTINPTVTATVTQTTTVPATFTTTTATTTLTTTSTTTTSVSTAVSTIAVTYSQIALPGNNCVYNRYYDYPDVNNNPANNYQQGRTECRALCTNNPRCKFYFFLHFDPAKARGYDASACILDEFPYDASYLQCNYVNDVNFAYNKNP